WLLAHAQWRRDHGILLLLLLVAQLDRSRDLEPGPAFLPKKAVIYDFGSMNGYLRCVVAAIVLATTLAATAAAQTISNISGKVISADDGLPLADAPIQAKNTSSGAVYNARSGQDGAYTMRVPVGTYEVSASYPGLVPYKIPDIDVEPGEPALLEIKIESPYL